MTLLLALAVVAAVTYVVVRWPEEVGAGAAHVCMSRFGRLAALWSLLLFVLWRS